jgi:hypothetical protein
VPEKIAKNTKNIPIDSFLFLLSDPIKIIAKKSPTKGGNFDEIVTWTNPFYVKSPIKGHSWALVLFFTHPSTTCNMSVTDGTELSQRWPIPETFGCVEEAQNFGATKKAWVK